MQFNPLLNNEYKMVTHNNNSAELIRVNKDLIKSTHQTCRDVLHFLELNSSFGFKYLNVSLI